MNKLEEVLKVEGWVKMSYKNCGVEYFAWHKDRLQIADAIVQEIDDDREWKPVNEGDVRITDFNKHMSQEERDYYGEELDETR